MTKFGKAEMRTKKFRRYQRYILRVPLVLFVGVLGLVSKRISLATNQVLGAAVGAVFATFSRFRRRVAQANLALCFPDMTDAERHRVMRLSFRELGKMMFEAFYLWQADESRIRALVVYRCF